VGYFRPRLVSAAELSTVPLLIIDDRGMRKLPHTGRQGPSPADHAS